MADQGLDELEKHSGVSATEAHLRRLQGILDASLEIGIVTTDSAGSITMFSRGAERMLGVSEGEVLGKHILAFHDKDEIRARANELRELLNRPVPDEEVPFVLARNGGVEIHSWSYTSRMGRRFEVSLSVRALHSEASSDKGFLLLIRDISEQVEAEDRLIELNIALEKRVAESTHELQLANQHLFHTLEDLTLAKDRLVRSEKLAGLGAVVTAVAHEINTPVGVCLTTASTLETHIQYLLRLAKDGGLTRRAVDRFAAASGEGLALLQRNLQRTADLVSRFKGLAADHGGETRCQFELSRVVEQAVTLKQPIFSGKQVLVECRVPDAINMDGYPEAITQLIGNLLDNAATHAFAGRDSGTIRISAEAVVDKVRLRFADDGCGMAPNVLEHVFDPFFTTRLGQGNNGLGMSICYNLVTGLMGGSLEVTSEPGEGCTYLITMPRMVPDLNER